MIAFRNHAESEDFQGGAAGTLTTASLGGIWVAPCSLLLKAILARLGTAGGTQATIVDILKNGTSIFSSGKINFATSSQTPTYGPLTANPTTFVKGDIIKVTVTQVGSVPAPADLGLGLVFSRLHGAKVVAAMLTDTFGADNES